MPNAAAGCSSYQGARERELEKKGRGTAALLSRRGGYTSVAATAFIAMLSDMTADGKLR